MGDFCWRCFREQCICQSALTFADIPVRSVETVPPNTIYLVNGLNERGEPNIVGVIVNVTFASPNALRALSSKGEADG